MVPGHLGYILYVPKYNVAFLVLATLKPSKPTTEAGMNDDIL
jgi:hypothetical protein